MRLLVALFSLALCVIAQTKEDLGVQTQSITNTQRVMFVSGGATHLVGFYDRSSDTAPLQLFHVNMTTGASYVEDLGRTLAQRRGICGSQP
jgi:hypothetical protein